MQKEKKIQYSNYKYEAYKKLNKLFLNKLKQLGITGTESVLLDFQIEYYIPSNRYRVVVFYGEWGIICTIPYTDSDEYTISIEIGRGGSCYVGNNFSNKMESYLKELLKYKLPDTVEIVRFYANNSQISYSYMTRSYMELERGRSGYPEKEKPKHLEKGKSKFYAG